MESQIEQTNPMMAAAAHFKAFYHIIVIYQWLNFTTFCSSPLISEKPNDFVILKKSFLKINIENKFSYYQFKYISFTSSIKVSVCELMNEIMLLKN